MQIITVRTGAPYDIRIGNGLLDQAGEAAAAVRPGARAAVVTDDVVDGLYAARLMRSLAGSGVDAVKFVFAHGEASKSHERLMEIYDFLSREGITRADMLIALGGGVTGDLCGYAAASWHRGVPYIQIPTTLLAAVDSSVGGKTAVNIPAGKNLVGAFWQPSLVLCDPGTLDTLPREIFLDGVGECLKYGAVFDAALFNQLSRGGASQRADMETVIARCVDLKRQVVEDDERDTGRRQLLNFGHTLGHAIERETGFAVSHGKAVGIGMAEITRRTEALGLTAPGSAERVARALEAYGMPSRYEGDLRGLIPAVLGDKKRHGQEISFVILDHVGAARLHRVPAPDIQEFLCGGTEA